MAANSEFIAHLSSACRINLAKLRVLGTPARRLSSGDHVHQRLRVKYAQNPALLRCKTQQRSCTKTSNWNICRDAARILVATYRCSFQHPSAATFMGELQVSQALQNVLALFDDKTGREFAATLATFAPHKN